MLCIIYVFLFSQSQSNYLLNQYSNATQTGNYFPSFTTTTQSAHLQDPIIGPITDPISELCEKLCDMNMGFLPFTSLNPPAHLHHAHLFNDNNQHNNKQRNIDYMCHICFKKDHNIRDCPQVK